MRNKKNRAKMIRLFIIFFFLTASFLNSCGGGGDGTLNGSGSGGGSTPALVSIAVTPANPSGPVGSTQQFTATGTYSDGTIHDMTTQVTWSSSNTGVASIGSSGLSNAVNTGATMISALSGNISGSTTLTVNPTGGLDNWHLRTSGTTDLLYGVTYSNGTFVIVSIAGTVLTSTDGVTWTQRNSGTTYPLTAVTYGNGTFVAVSGIGTVLTSTDGVTWTPRNSGTTNQLTGVTYGNNIFVAVGEDLENCPFRSDCTSYYPLILTSTNGITWTQEVSGAFSGFYGLTDGGVTYGNGASVAVGLNGTVLTSTNGATWTQKNSGTANSLTGVTYGDGIFVAVGENGTLLTSADGTTWTQRSSGTNTLYGVTYGNGAFVAVGFNGTVLTSTGGVTWTQRSSGITNQLQGVTFGNGTFLSVGWSGVIIQSDPL